MDILLFAGLLAKGDRVDRVSPVHYYFVTAGNAVTLVEVLKKNLSFLLIGGDFSADDVRREFLLSPDRPLPGPTFAKVVFS